MLSKINSATIHGINALPVIIETDISRGLPGLNIVGLADITVKEARERIRSAIINSGINYPCSRITINMSPASIRKKGSHFDLPMALGILSSAGFLFSDELKQYGIIGELSLDGTVNKVNGVLPMVIAMRDSGIKKVVIPRDNREEASLIEDVNIYPVSTLEEVIEHFNLIENIKPYIIERKKLKNKARQDYLLDFSDVKGQEFAKRAITISVAGGHGILMTGSPATGKTMISQRIPTIMPEMTFDEIVESTIIYSVAGLLSDKMPYVTTRPFRKPHHKITSVGILGGGAYPRPGEISLANKGVLFLDEVGEFDRNLLDTLRIPLEEKKITIVRRGENYVYPADFLLVAATNPCKCGYYGDPTHKCTCKEHEVFQYQHKLSGPVLDRIDMNIRLLSVEYEELKGEKTASSEEMRRLINSAREHQRKRYINEDISLNNQLDDHLVEKYCRIDEDGMKLLELAYSKMNLNPRTLMKVKKVARTIADLEGSENISGEHIAESLQYREEQVR